MSGRRRQSRRTPYFRHIHILDSSFVLLVLLVTKRDEGVEVVVAIHPGVVLKDTFFKLFFPSTIPGGGS